MPDIQVCNMQAFWSISVVELLWMLVDVLSEACAADLWSIGKLTDCQLDYFDHGIQHLKHYFYHCQ